MSRTVSLGGGSWPWSRSPRRHGRASPFIPVLLADLLQVRDAAQAINYGLGRARLPAPVPVGSRVRLTAIVEKVEPVPSGFQVSLASTVECDAAPKPACAVQVLCRFVGPAGPVGAAPGPDLDWRQGGEQR